MQICQYFFLLYITIMWILGIQDTYVCQRLALVNISTTKQTQQENETIKIVEKEDDEGVMI